MVVAPPVGGGPEFAVNADALAVRATSAKVRGLSASEGDVTRVRLGLEGSWAVRFEMPVGYGLTAFGEGRQGGGGYFLATTNMHISAHCSGMRPLMLSDPGKMMGEAVVVA